MGDILIDRKYSEYSKYPGKWAAERVRHMLAQAKNLRAALIQHRRAIHQHAEIRFDLPWTRAYVLEALAGMGYSPRELGGGIVAVAGNNPNGKTFLLRADMDALPIREENDFPFRSQTESMHACGHDLHTAMLLGAAQLLKACECDLRGQVKLMFQPAEEVMGGAIRMIEEGVLQNPSVDAAMMIHVMPALPVPAGTAIFSGGNPGYAACDWFEISIQGKGGHGAMPHTAVDPLNVAAHTHIALQAIVAREISPRTPIVITVGEMHGGTVSNVIPDAATLRGTIRTFDESARAFAKERVLQVAQGVAATFRAQASVAYSMGCPAVVADAALDARLMAYAREIVGPERVTDSAALARRYAESGIAAGMGSEDFAFISQAVPGACIILAAGAAEDGYGYPIHHPKSMFDEDALAYGAALYAGCAARWLAEGV